jgi:hypothetical protein
MLVHPANTGNREVREIPSGVAIMTSPQVFALEGGMSRREAFFDRPQNKDPGIKIKKKTEPCRFSGSSFDIQIEGDITRRAEKVIAP